MKTLIAAVLAVTLMGCSSSKWPESFKAEKQQMFTTVLMNVGIPAQDAVPTASCVVDRLSKKYTVIEFVALDNMEEGKRIGAETTLECWCGLGLKNHPAYNRMCK
jgi:hypothetical protein